MIAIANSTKSWIAQVYGKDGELSKKILHIILIALGVVLLKLYFQDNIFQCPEKDYQHFSLVVFFVPPILLFFIGWLSNPNFQQGVTGIFYHCWNKTDRQLTCSRIRWRRLIDIILTSHINAYVAPFFWFLFCLLDGRIVTCYNYGPPLINSTDEQTKSYQDLKIYSKIIGINMLVITIAALSILLTVKACFKKRNRCIEMESLEVLDNFALYEANAAHKHFEDLIKKAAEKNGREKVDLLMKLTKAKESKDVENPEDGLEEDIQSMYYAPSVKAGNSLMQIHPNVCEAYHSNDVGPSEQNAFRKVLSQLNFNQFQAKRPVNYKLSKGNNDEKNLLIEIKDQNYQSTTT